MAGKDKEFGILDDVASATDGDTDLVTVPKVPPRYADESFKLFSKVRVGDPTPEEALRIKRKLIWRIIPFLCVGYHLMYVDKQTVSAVVTLRYQIGFFVFDKVSYSWAVRPS